MGQTAIAGTLLTLALLVGCGGEEPPAAPDALAKTPEVSTERERRHTRSEEPPAAPAPEPSAEPDEDDVLLVRVLDSAGSPLPRVRVVRLEREADGSERSPFASRDTDDEGEVRFRRDPTVTDVILCEALGIEREADSSSVVLRATEPLMPVSARFLDLDTGAPLDTPPEHHVVDGPWTSRALVITRGGATWIDVDLEIPTGYAAPYRGLCGGPVLVGSSARELQLTVPLPRAVNLRVAVKRADGSPAKQAEVQVWEFSEWGWLGSPRAQTGDDGVATFDISHARGESVRLRVIHAASLWVDWLRKDLPASPGPLRVDLTLPRVSLGPAPERPTIGIGGGGFQTRETRMEPGDPDGGMLRLLVRRADGGPARRAFVSLVGAESRRRRTDDTGAVRFAGLAPSRYEAWLTEPGCVPTVVVATVPKDRTLDLTLTEQAPKSAVVAVEDADGRPLPCASVYVQTSVGGEPLWIAQVTDGVQHARVFTGPNGEVRLVGLPTKGVVIRAEYGSRSVSEKLDDSGRLVLTMPPAK